MISTARRISSNSDASLTRAKQKGPASRPRVAHPGTLQRRTFKTRIAPCSTATGRPRNPMSVISRSVATCGDCSSFHG